MFVATQHTLSKYVCVFMCV